MIDFEWDAQKSAANVDKHGIDFDDAIGIFLGPTLEAVDNRYEYGEVRTIALGEVNGHVLAVVYTLRGETCRIISARKANRHERERYHQAIAERPPEGPD